MTTTTTSPDAAAAAVEAAARELKLPIVRTDAARLMGYQPVGLFDRVDWL